MADPFADLIPQGGSEQGGTIDLPAYPRPTPVTQYSIPRRALGGKQGDELYDSGTARGVGSSENELAPGVVAVNPSIYPIGTIFKDGDTNEVFVAGDKHGNRNPNVIDIYTPPSQYTGSSGNRNIVPIGRIPASQVPKTANGVGELLSNYGKVPQGEGAYTSLGQAQSQQGDPFADLIPQQQGTNATAPVSEQVFDPFSDLIPQKQAQAQATPSSVASTASTAQNASQVSPEVETPAEAPSSASKLIGGIVSPFGYIGQEGWNAIAGIQRTFGYDKAANESAQIAANSVEDWANTFGGTAPEQGSAAETAGKIGGAVVSFPALAMTGLAGAGTMIASGYGNIKEDLYNKYKQQGLSDQEANQKSTTHAAVTTIATLPAYILGGKAAGKVADRFIAEGTPKLIDATARFGFNTVANSVASAVVRGMSAAMDGEDPYKAAKELTLGGFVQDAMFAGHSVAEHFKMESRKGKAAEEITKVSDAMLGVLAKDAKYADIANKEIQRRKDAVAPQVSPSANPVVNEREQQINAMADAQAPVPEAPTPAPAPAVETPSAKAPAADLTSLILDQTLYDEGSAKWNEIQAQIDSIKKPAEAPAEAQPTQPNAIQEPSATEAMLHPQVTGQGEVVELPRVGEQKPEVPAKEAEAPKEEVVIPSSLEEAKSPQEVDAYVKSQKEFWGKSRMGFDEGTRQRALKALGMQSAARKRQLTGNLTAKEQAAKDKREASNYVGKPVSVEGRNGTIIGNPFGRVKVRFSDGTESTHIPEKIEAPVAEPTAQEAKAPQVSEQKPEEVKPTLPQLVQDEFTTFARKQGGLNKAQAQKALIEYEKAGNINVGEDGQFYFTKGEHSSRESLRKAAGIEEAPQESPSSPIRDILHRFQSGEEDSIDTLKGLADSVSDAAKKTKNKYLADLASEIQDAVDAGVEIGDAQDLVNRTLAALEGEANRMEAPKEKKTPAERVKTRKDKAREVFGDAAEGLSYVLENKILDPAEYRKRVKAGIIQGGGEYDFFYNHKFPRKVRDLIFSRTGRPIDIVSDDAGFKNPHDLLVAIDEAHRTAEASKEQAAEMEKRQKAREENIRKMAELEKTNPEAHAAEVENDVRKYLQGRMRGEGGYFTLPEIIYDAAVSVGRSVAKGARDFKSWSGEMVNRLGEGVRNFLHRIYNAISTGGGRFLKRGAERGAIDLTGEERFKPKPPTEQEAFAKKAADAILKGRGTPITQDELANILARKFPGISPREVGDLYATASGRPKTAGYAGVFSEPSQQGTMFEQRTTGLKKSVVKQESLSRGLEDIPQQERQSETERVQRAVDRVQADSAVAPSIVARIVDFKEPNISVDDAAALLVERNRLMNDRQNWENILDDESKSPAERNNAQLQLDSIEEQLNRLDEAQRATGSEWGRLGRMYQRMIAEDYSLESMERKERRNLGRPLERQERERLKKEAESIQKTTEELQAAQEKAQTEQEKVAVAETYWKTIQELKAELASRPKVEPQIQRIIDRIGKTIKSQADQARERIRQRRSEGRFMSGLDPTDIADHAIIGADYIYEGATDLAKFTTRMVKELGEYVRPYIKQIFAASQKQYDATTDRVAGNKAEKVRETTPKSEQSIAQIKATGKAEKVANPFLPTLEHLEDPLTHKLVYELARQHILEGVKGEDNVMKAVHNDIKDVYPDATERDVRRAFSEYGKAKFPSKEADRVALAELRTLTRLQESIDRLTEGLPALKTGLQRNKNTQLIREKQAKLNELLKKVKLPPTEEELASRDAAKQTALRNRIADLDKQLRTGEKLKRIPTEPDSPETENLRLEKNAMEQLIKEIEGEAKPKKTPEEAYNERRQKAIRKKIAEIEDRIKNNRYEKAPKRIPKTKNTDTQRLELELKRKQNEFDRRQLQYQEKLKPRWQRMMQETSEFAKGMAITGYHSLEKILGFDIAKLISTPIEEFTGSAVSKLTGIKPKEGSLESGGGTIQGLLRYYKGLVKGAIEAPKVLKTGLSESEELFGKVRPNVARWYDFIGGRLHASLKHIPFTAQEELYRYRGLANAEKVAPGSTKSDLVKMAIYKAAYERAQSAKLQEANKVAEAINGYFTRLEQIDPKTGKSSVAGNFVSMLAKTFITKGIIKTPANYFKQVMRGIFGLPEGAGRVMRAYWNGIENLTPEETDAIYKAFKVGGIGFAAGLYGYIDSFKDKKDRKFGGYYQAGRKEGDGDAKWGTIRIGGHVFHYIAHNPVTEIMQFGSTVGRVQQALMKKTDMPTAIATGFGKSLIALLGSAPVSGPLMRLGQPYSDPIGEISRGLVPALISNIAQDTKGETKLAPTNPAQQIMANIPGLQKYVPTAKPKKSSASGLGKGMGGFGKGL